MTLRPSTNLLVPPHLTLPKKDLKSNFLYVYGHAYSGSAVTFMTKLWASMFFPSLTNDPKFGAGRRNKARIGELFLRQTPASLLRVQIVHEPKPHIVASFPVFSFFVDAISASCRMLRDQFIVQPESDLPLTVRQIAEVEALRSYFADHDPKESKDLLFHPTQVFRAAHHLDTLATENLKHTLQGVRLQTKGNLAIVFLDFKISAAEAQQLTTTDWPQIRTIDVYPLLLEWVHTFYGERTNPPLASFPVSRIAATLPADHVKYARVNDKGISLGPNGKPYYFPAQIPKHQTTEYEEKYISAGSRADGSYALTDIYEAATAYEQSQEIKTKLPHNCPVLIDWVNDKYSYTDTQGRLQVMDLMRYRAIEVTHVRTLLEERHTNEDQIELWTRMGKSAGVFGTEFAPSPLDFEGPCAKYERHFRTAKTAIEWYGIVEELWLKENDMEGVRYCDLATNAWPLFRPLARYFKKIAYAVKENIEAVYRDYSVKTVMENLSWLLLIAEYADQLGTLRENDLVARAPAIKQGIDPDWVLPPVPMIDRLREIGLIPHQVKIRNILRDSPLFALLPVQAGGGKSLLLITDILYEILFYRPFPYLLLCPGHLLANYVNEVLYFTGGQLNVLPINGLIIREHGFERLQKMLETMPRNTVVVVDYDTLRYRQQTICYGTSPIIVYPVIDFLRQFHFKYVGLDESHKVKNDSSRTRSTMCLITDIPKIRLASGTMCHDSPSDLAMQVGVMDPTLFGTKNEFNARYGLSVSGGRVMHWKPGAQEKIQRKINSRIVTARAMRKEWAAFLPNKHEWIGGVDLHPAQQLVYDSILEETIEKIEQDSKNNKKLALFLGREDQAEEDDEDSVLDEDARAEMASLLRPYLARLERFLMAPAKDPLGDKLLRGEDRISPKVKLVLERVRLHLFGGTVRDPQTGQQVEVPPQPGKVIVFTNNVVSAEEVYEVADEELKRCGILYKAEHKTEHGAQFEFVDRFKWLVGVEVSMNEGLNYQFAARTILPETVWNPGMREQGNSRTNRPELKKTDVRSNIYYDSVVVNYTIDITKAARLISKTISVAKFENNENPAYATIPDVPIIKMSLESIRTFNTWEYVDDERPGLAVYAQALARYEQVRDQDYQEYKDRFYAEYGNRSFKTMLGIAPTPDDAKIMDHVPYVPGAQLLQQAKLKAVRIDEYLNIVEDEMEEDGSEYDTIEARTLTLNGKRTHTEFGEGRIVRNGSAKNVSVRLDSGYVVKVRKSAAYLIDPAYKGNQREIAASMLGMALIPVPAVMAPAMKLSHVQNKLAKAREDKKAARDARIRLRAKKKALTFDLQIVVTNGYLGLKYEVRADQQLAIQTMQACGFRNSSEYVRAVVPKSSDIAKQFREWKAAGFAVHHRTIARLRTWFEELREQADRRIEAQERVRRFARSKVPNFYKEQFEAVADRNIVRPFPLYENGKAYIALPVHGQPWAIQAMNASSLSWQTGKQAMTFFGTVKEIKQVAKKLKAAGVTVSNAAQINRQFRKIKNLKVRVHAS
jgi:hypothetical protein